MKFVLIGHVDHGKSTLAGSFLYHSNNVNKNYINKNSNKKQSLAHLTDINEDEKIRGITLELNMISFEYQNKKLTIYDSPGHKLLLREMVTGCALTDIPILVISINNYEQGLSGQCIEHAVIARCTSSSLIVTWNKMDLIQWSSDIYHSLKNDFTKRIKRLKFKQIIHIPICASSGQNVFDRYNNKLATMSLIEAMNTMNISKCNIKLIYPINSMVHGLFIIYQIDNVLSPGFKCLAHSYDKIYNVKITNVKNGKLNFATIKNAKKPIHITLKISADQIHSHIILRKNDNTIAIGVLKNIS